MPVSAPLCMTPAAPITARPTLSATVIPPTNSVGPLRPAPGSTRRVATPAASTSPPAQGPPASCPPPASNPAPAACGRPRRDKSRPTPRLKGPRNLCRQRPPPRGLFLQQSRRMLCDNVLAAQLLPVNDLPDYVPPPAVSEISPLMA